MTLGIRALPTLIIAVSFFTCIISAAPSLSQWTKVNPFPTANHFSGVSYCKDQWLAVGEYGLIYGSTDGREWTLLSARNESLDFRGIRYAQDAWVAFGYRTYIHPGHGDLVTGGVVLVSTNLSTWEQINLPPEAILGLDFANGVWTAVGGHSLLTSTNAREWTERLNVPVEYFSDVKHANQRWVAVGTPGMIHTSTDALDWTRVNSPTNASITKVSHADGHWMAVGSGCWRLRSVDGLNWTLHPLPIVPGLSPGNTRYTALAFGNGKWIAANNLAGNFVTGDNTTQNWSVQTIPFRARSIYGVAHHEGLWIAGGSIGEILTSTNGSTWVSPSSRMTDAIQDAVFAEGKWVTAGGDILRSGQIGVSTNAVDWTLTDFAEALYSIDYHQGQWVTVGPFGNGYRSTNAVNWERLSTSTARTLMTVRFHEGLWTAVGYGAIITSPDGVNWTPRGPATLPTFLALGAANHQWVAAGDRALSSSTNGIDWESHSIPAATLYAVAHGNGLWLAGGTNPDDPRQVILLQSTNGTDWNAVAHNIEGTIRSLEYSDGQWVATTFYGDVLISIDGLAWTRRATLFSGLQKVILTGELTLAVGYYGQIMVSRPEQGLSLETIFANGQLRLRWPAIANYRLEATPDLKTPFAPHAGTPALNGEFLETVINPAGSAGFFRLAE